MLGNIKNRWSILLFIFISGLLYASVFYQYLSKGIMYNIEVFRIYRGVMLLALIVLVFPEKWKENFILPIFRFLLAKRYLICLVIFALLVVFQISRSSINMIDTFTGEKAGNGNVSHLLFGYPMILRSDEWGVNTLYHIAQVNSDAFFPVINKLIGMDGQNMLLACNSPVWHISLIGKPQTWGYFFLGASGGLSWFWWFRFFALLLGSYETGIILSKGNRKLAVFLAITIVFSPLYIWWYSSSIYDLAISGQWLFVGFYYFFFSVKYKKKLAAAIVFLMSSVGYCVALYPAMQLPLGYLILILMLYFLIAHKKELVFGKWEFVTAAAVAAVFLLTMAFFLKDSYADILKIMNTAYPGKRETVTGGQSPAAWFYYVIGCVLPFRSVPFLNNCEVSMVPLFLVTVVVLLVIYLWKGKGGEKVLIGLLGGYGAFLLSMYVVSYPSWFLKATLMSFTTVARNMAVVGFISLYLIVIILSRRKEMPGLKNGKKTAGQWCGKIMIYFAAGIAAAVVMLVESFRFGVGDYISVSVLIICVLIFVMLEQFILWNRQRELVAGVFITIAVTSMLVNPVTSNADSVTESELVKTVQEIDKDRQANWLVLDTWIDQNVLAANGIRVINAVQYEPNLDYWHTLDKEGEYEEIYNRYAHIVAKLTDKKTRFKLTDVDSITVYFNYDDLKEDQVDYIVAKEEISGWENRLERIAFCKNGGYFIYRIKE